MNIRNMLSNGRGWPGRGLKIGAIAVLISLVVVWAFARGDTAAAKPASEDGNLAMDEGQEKAVFAGGCFWGIEAVFEQLDGVIDVMSGYSGGEEETASYYVVATGKTGHAESVQILYDSNRIDYETLLEVFFNVAHDPTQLNYQYPDYGTEYRSAVFYADEKQRKATERYIKELEKMKVYDDPIVTEVTPLDAFFPAEDYHQDFVRLNPTYPYVVRWDLPKIAHLKRDYPELLKEKE